MIKTFCDRCEKEIDRLKEGCGNIRFDLYKNDGSVLSTHPNKQLCQPCFTALELFLNNK